MIGTNEYTCRPLLWMDPRRDKKEIYDAYSKRGKEKNNYVRKWMKS
jgi:hypothetical protein